MNYLKIVEQKILEVKDLIYEEDGKKILDKISFTVQKGDKIAFVGANTMATTTLFKILNEEMEPDSGSFKWGVTTQHSYFPKDNTAEFKGSETIVDHLMPFSPVDDQQYVRGFLGRMLFTGEDGVKKVNVLSGGERVRVMLSKMMILILRMD